MSTTLATPSSKLGSIRIDGTDYALDRLTLGDLRDLKKLSGATIDNLDTSDPDVMIALVYIIMRRDRPEFSVDDAANIELAAIAPDPEPAPAAPAAPVAPADPEGAVPPA